MRERISLSQTIKIWLPLAIAAAITLVVIWQENHASGKEIDDLIRAFHDKARPNHHLIAYKLAETGDSEALKPLVRALENRSYLVRSAAAGALGKFDDRHAVEPLIKALKDPSPVVRENAARALGELGDRQAALPLSELLLEECREHPAKIQGYTTKDEKRVVTSVSSGGSSVSSIATAALIQIGSPAIDALVLVLEEGEICARSEGARAMGEIGSAEAVIPLLDLVRKTEWTTVRSQARRALEKSGPAAIDPLLEALKDRSPTVRRVAAECLGKAGTKRSTEALTEMLDDPDKECRRAASMALLGLGDPAGIPNLITQLNSEDVSARANAALALGSMDSTVLPDLISALGDERRNVRLNAVRSLGRIGDPMALDPLAEYLTKQRPTSGDCVQAVHSIRSIGGPEAMDTLSRLLRDQVCVGKVLPALDAFGPPAVGILFRAMENLDGRFHGQIIRALGNIGDPRSAYLLAAFLKDENKYFRIAAASGLGKIADPRTSGALIVALDDSNANVRLAVVKALGEIRGRDAVEPLLSLFQQTKYPWSTGGEDTLLFGAAAEALGNIGDPRAVDALKTLLLNDIYLCTTAAEALAKLGKPGFEALCDVLVDEGDKTRTRVARVRAFRRLREVGPPAIDTIRAALQKASGRIKTDLLELLTEIDDSLSMEIFLNALEDEDPEVRVWAAVSLGQRGGPEVVQPLLTVLRDPDKQVERAAAGGLGLQGRSIVSVLIDLLREDDGSLRFHAAWNLGEIGDSSAVEPLIPLLTDSHEPTRFVAAEALAKIGLKKTPKLILRAYKHEECGTRRTVATTLGELETDEAFQRIIPSLLKGCPPHDDQN